MATIDMTYAEKLRDPRWQKKRLKIMERDQFTCAFCYDTERTLNVHHLIYYPNRAPWEYEDDELVTLCEDCHKWATEFLKRIRLQLNWDINVSAYQSLASLVDDMQTEAMSILNALEANRDLIKPVYDLVFNKILKR